MVFTKLTGMYDSKRHAMSGSRGQNSNPKLSLAACSTFASALIPLSGIGDPPP